MHKLVPIVEGQGDADAVPKLLHKILNHIGRYDIQVAQPKNANGCENLYKNGGLEKFLTLASLERNCGAILVIVDADHRRYCDVAHDLAARANSHGPRQPVFIVVANREYEAWFLASLETISGQLIEGRTGLPAGITYDGDVENIKGVKGWLSRHMPDGRAYKERMDQAPLTSMIDIELARSKSRSFRRICHAVELAAEAIDKGAVFVSPSSEPPQS